MENAPTDIYLKIFGKVIWMDDENKEAYLSGAQTAVYTVALFVKHGVRYANTEHWKTYLYHGQHFLSAKETVEYVRGQFPDGAPWFTEDVFVRPEIMSGIFARRFAEAVGGTAFELFSVYRFLEANVGCERLDWVWENYLISLLEKLERLAD